MITKEMVNNYLSEDYDEWIANVLTDICNDPHSISILRKQIIEDAISVIGVTMDGIIKEIIDEGGRI